MKHYIREETFGNIDDIGRMQDIKDIRTITDYHLRRKLNQNSMYLRKAKIWWKIFYGTNYLYHSHNLDLYPCYIDFWNCAMMIAFSFKNKLWFIDGLIPKQKGTNLMLLNSWIHKTNMVILWILNSISKEIFDSILYSNLAHDILIDLRYPFQQSNRGHNF